ncbi:MAG: hypothetical protein HYR56_27125 [Acidobacteria bacterium]|nr:hypothetical protein [Acidobacteriota bacterium]MBI3425456.1 hypothetical protein [Acidobacteriota bacterium]
MKVYRISLLVLVCSLFSSGAHAQKLEFAPGTRYDTHIPTLKQTTGYDLGESVTTPEQITAYLKALADAAPDRTRLLKYADTFEGRPLHALIIATPERMRRLDEIKAGLQRLANPGALSNSEAERLVKELPAVVVLMHGVHGNEISSGEAALAEAYHLLAARGDANVDTILRECLVLIDPMQNPDGRARFVFQNLFGRAAQPDPEPAAAEHDEPWPGGRSNHYLFDLNRDWFAQTQPETKGRARLLLDWPAQVAVDLHEQGGDATYYFPPAATPYNPHLSKAQLDWYDVFGRANAARFDERGFAYFNREVYDAFYPGYGVSWPSAQGALGMTFEMASARGLAYRRRDDTVLSYLDGAVRHFTSAMTTALTAARNREKLLRDFYEFRRNAGKGTTQAYLLPPGQDAGQTLRLVRTLQANGVNVQRAAEPIQHESRTLPVGTFIVPLPQPAGALVRNLLDSQVPMSAEFLKVQEERRKNRLPDQIYDITAWNLPLLYDVECLATDRAVTAKTTPVETTAAPATLPDAIVGYALPWNATAAAVTLEALQTGLRARFLNATFTLAGRKFSKGTAFFRASDNGPDLATFKAKLAAIVAKHGAEVVKLDSAFVEEGTSLGSNQVVALRAPRVLLAWDQPASSLSAGWTRYVLERRYQQPVTAVRASSLARVDWRRYDVLVLPSGNYAAALSGDTLRRLKDWLNAGGTLITLGEASRWAARESTALLDTRTEWRDGSPETDAPPARTDAARKPADFDQAIQPARELPELVPGALLRVTLNDNHWLSAGTDNEVQVQVESTRVFTPIKLDKGVNVGIYAPKDRLLASGLIWPESLAQLPQKAFLIHQPYGQGHLIAFAEDPNYRAYAEATMFLFMNAVVLGTAY